MARVVENSARYLKQPVERQRERVEGEIEVRIATKRDATKRELELFLELESSPSDLPGLKVRNPVFAMNTMRRSTSPS